MLSPGDCGLRHLIIRFHLKNLREQTQRSAGTWRGDCGGQCLQCWDEESHRVKSGVSGMGAAGTLTEHSRVSLQEKEPKGSTPAVRMRAGVRTGVLCHPHWKSPFLVSTSVGLQSYHNRKAPTGTFGKNLASHRKEADYRPFQWVTAQRKGEHFYS